MRRVRCDVQQQRRQHPPYRCRRTHARRHARTHARTHAHVHVHAHEHLHKHACTRTRVQVCMHARTHARTRARTRTRAQARTHSRQVVNSRLRRQPSVPVAGGEELSRQRSTTGSKRYYQVLTLPRVLKRGDGPAHVSASQKTWPLYLTSLRCAHRMAARPLADTWHVVRDDEAPCTQRPPPPGEMLSGQCQCRCRRGGAAVG
jgi:hypothetical protein